MVFSESSYLDTNFLNWLHIRVIWEAFKNYQMPRGDWVAQSVGRRTLSFSSGHDLRVLRLSSTLGSMLRAESACPSPSAHPLLLK